MEDVEMDDMELDQDDMEVDQGRRQRAAKKFSKRFNSAQLHGDEPKGNPNGDTKGDWMSTAQARDILRQVSELCCGNKISVDNAFDLQGIDALRALVFSDGAKDSALSSEGHFQNAGIGLEAGTKIYSKRVDAVYNLANSINYGQAFRKADDDDGAGQDQDGKGDNEQGDGGADGGARGSKAKKRLSSASAEATLVRDDELRQRVKEPTLDMDPFFVRTSRLIDDHSPQGLLLHNLPVLNGYDIIFDSNVRPQELLEQARDKANIEDAANHIMVDLSLLPGGRELLAAVKVVRAPISPGIEQLYAQLKPRTDLPGLQLASGVDPEKLLRDALATNEGAKAEACRKATERQAIQQAEDMMDVEDMHDGDTGGLPDGPDCGSGNEAEPPIDRPGDDDRGGDDLGGSAGGSEGALYEGFDSPDYAAGGPGCDDDGVDDAQHGLEGSQRVGGGTVGADSCQRSTGTYDDGEAGPIPGGSDDESVLLSLCGGDAASCRVGNSATLQGTWWKSYVRKAPAAAGAKPRQRKPKPESEPLDWRASPQPLLEAVQLHTYKTARRDASAKLCMPLEEPSSSETLHGYFSAAPAVADQSLPEGGRSFGTLAMATSSACVGGFAFSVRETWRALLILDRQHDYQQRRSARAASRKSFGNTAATRVGGTSPGELHSIDELHFAGPPTSSTGGLYGATDGGGESYGVQGHNEAGCGAGGNMTSDVAEPSENDTGGGGYGGCDDDDDYDDGGGGSNNEGVSDIPYNTQDGRGPTLEELLQPPRVIRRIAVKYDKTAGVADVATLKTNIEVSLKTLATSSVSQCRQSAPQAPQPLSFQSVLDQVSAIATGKVEAGAGPCARSNTAPSGSSGSGGGSFLTGVSTHLAFICLLHLANEKGLALESSERLDSLIITGLGDLSADQ